MRGDWAGESLRCEDPAPTVGIAGHIATGHHIRPTGINGHGVKAKETTRHAASLRPPRNGRIGCKPPYSQRGTLPLRTAGRRYARGGYKGRGGLCSDVACRVASKKTQRFGDRSAVFWDRDAARHVATKTRRPRSPYAQGAKTPPV